MVTADQRRQAVRQLQETFGVSQRRACRVLGQPRSTQRQTLRRALLAQDTTGATFRDAETLLEPKYRLASLRGGHHFFWAIS